MFIATRQNKITAPAEPNVAAALHMALRWSAIPLGRGCYKHLAPPGAKSRRQETITPVRLLELSF